MLKEIADEAQYNQVVALIEKIIAKATESGGFNFLSAPEQEELSQLSKLAEQYEDTVLKIMPFPVN